MAGVKLVFAGDASQLNKTFDSIEANSKAMAKTVDAQSSKVAASFDRMADSSDSAEGPIMGLADVLDGLATSMGLPIDGAINMARAAGDMTGGFAQLGPVIGKVGAALGGLALNPVVLGITALAAALVLAYTKSETFRNIVQGVFKSIQNVVGPILDWLGKGLSWVGGLFGDTGDDADDMADKMKEAAERSQQVWDTWKGKVAEALDSIVDPLNRARENSKVGLDEIKKNLDDNVKFFAGWIANLKSLTERGFGELAKFFFKLGPTAEKAVGEAYKMTDPQLQRLQDNIVGKLDTAGKVGAEVLINGIGGAGYEELGRTIGDQVTSGIEEGLRLLDTTFTGQRSGGTAPPSTGGPTSPVGLPLPGQVSTEEWINRTKGWGGTTAQDIVNNNVTINVAKTDATPQEMAREMIWALN